MFNNKKIIITGHTGFKGAWLTTWLKLLGARIVGIALDPPTHPSHFHAACLHDAIEDYRIDIRNLAELKEIIISSQPDYLFHLAAQSLVGYSYENPLETWQTNVLGTLNVLEALRGIDKPCTAVIITSDKCYNNVEWVWGYRESDEIGGGDPYSASKGAAELAIRSHIKAYFSHKNNKVRIASARAGNVIGGGDWAEHRVVPDCVKAWSLDRVVELRNPHSTRPWQHVLEPLAGYLALAIALSKQPQLHAESFNFGPQAQQNRSVFDLVREMALHWDNVHWNDISSESAGPYEPGLLKLNCDKALHHLNWHAVMSFEETIKLTAEWYREFYRSPVSIKSVTVAQIQAYTAIARRRGLVWAQ